MDYKNFKIYTLGCKVNQYDSGVFKHKMLESGFVLSQDNPNIVIVNSCAVTKTALRKLRTLVNRLKREHPGAKLVLAGCATQAYPETIQEMGIDIAWGVGKFDELVEIILASQKKDEINVKDLNIGLSSRIIARDNKAGDRSRYFIKIQDGCNQFCTYCIVPHTRGSEIVSRPMKEVIEEIKAACEAGYEEVVLSGIHLGKYKVATADAGQDKKKLKAEGSGLLFLLKELVKLEKLKRIRLSSIEINEVTDRLIEFMAGEPKMCRHLHVPLQSGCDKILKLMNRPYRKQEFKDKIIKIKQKMPDIAISTDIIAGFPGESADDFEEIKIFVRDMKFSRLHIFSFSAHDITPASRLPGQIDAKEITRRSAELRKISDDLDKEYQNQFKGKNMELVVEKRIGENFIGKTEYFFDIKFARDQVLSKKNIEKGRIVKIRNK